MTSDSVIPTFTRARAVAQIIGQIAVDESEAFLALSYTMGGMMVFPGNRICGKNTINGARGFHHLVRDRFDLTLESIRRHYSGEGSPLGDVLARYADFFGLFIDFQRYVEFFMLQDLVTHDCAAVRFFMPFHDFSSSPLPASLEAYVEYRQLAVAFIESRNRRISEACRRG